MDQEREHDEFRRLAIGLKIEKYQHFVSALDRLWNESAPGPPRPVTG